MSNFLGDIGQPVARLPIISTPELIAREGIEPHKSMSFRPSGPLLSVFLVLERDGEFKDEWNVESGLYVFQGHNSTTTEEGKLKDQVLRYGDDRLSNNGKFYKAAQERKSGVRKEPLPVQVYEKLDAGVWFDKGVFDLVDAAGVQDNGRLVYKFYLKPHGAADAARMIPAAKKMDSWQRSQGRCEVCQTEQNLYFALESGEVRLVCGKHSGRRPQGLLGI